jgi:hypothetical protein
LNTEEVFYLPDLIRQISDAPDDQLCSLLLQRSPKNLETAGTSAFSLLYA